MASSPGGVHTEISSGAGTQWLWPPLFEQPHPRRVGISLWLVTAKTKRTSKCFHQRCPVSVRILFVTAGLGKSFYNVLFSCRCLEVRSIGGLLDKPSWVQELSSELNIVGYRGKDSKKVLDGLALLLVLPGWLLVASVGDGRLVLMNPCLIQYDSSLLIVWHVILCEGEGDPQH